MTRVRTCPTCKATLDPSLGYGVIGCPYCNTAIDMGPAPVEEDAPFQAPSSQFLGGQHDKPFGSSPAAQWGGQNRVQPPLPAQPMSQPPPMQTSYAVGQPASSGSGRTLLIIVAVLFVVMTMLGASCLFLVAA